MTIDTVKKNMPSEHYEPKWYENVGLIVVEVMIVILLILYNVNLIINEANNITILVVSVFLIALILIIMLQMIKVAGAEDLHDIDKSSWETDYVSPYLRTLQEVKVENINKLDIKPNGEANVTINVEGSLKRIWGIEIKLDLESKEDPVVTYKELTEDIGWFKAGKHQFILHLPKDYQF